jgi:hypothetical protein
VYDECDSIPFEARKAMKVYQIQPEWPNNYIAAVLENLKKFDIVLVSYCPELAAALHEQGIKFYFFAPGKTGWDTLVRRFQGRGNNQRFIDIQKMLFEQLATGPPPNVIYRELADDEFLEDALKKEELI